MPPNRCPKSTTEGQEGGGGEARGGVEVCFLWFVPSSIKSPKSTEVCLGGVSGGEQERDNPLSLPLTHATVNQGPAPCEAVHCCIRLSVGMMLRLTQRANDRYKDHLDGQLNTYEVAVKINFKSARSTKGFIRNN